MSSIKVTINNDSDNVVEYPNLECIPHYNLVFITHISFSNTTLTNFHYYLPNLTYLNCTSNKLSSIAYYPNLEYLDISNNQISELSSKKTTVGYAFTPKYLVS